MGPSGTPFDGSATVGTASQAVLPAASLRQHLLLQNQSATATIAVNFDAAAALGAAGSIDVPPKGTLRFDTPGFVPKGAVNVVASAAGTPVTVKAY